MCLSVRIVCFSSPFSSLILHVHSSELAMLCLIYSSVYTKLCVSFNINALLSLGAASPYTTFFQTNRFREVSRNTIRTLQSQRTNTNAYMPKKYTCIHNNNAIRFYSFLFSIESENADKKETVIHSDNNNNNSEMREKEKLAT